ncbi:MAG: hypothetical protein V4642_09500 [Bacteroidota bacterium]
MNSNKELLPESTQAGYSLQSFAIVNTLWTIIFSFSIIIVSNGMIMPLGLFEVGIHIFLSGHLTFKDVFLDEFKILLIFSVAGQFLLVTSFFFKKKFSNIIIKSIGIFSLWLGLFYWIINQSGILFYFTLISASPFIIASFYLVFQITHYFLKDRHLKTII